MTVQPGCNNPSRRRERGGMVILLSLLLLAIMTIGAMAVGQTALRDLAITGNEGTGRKAAEAADSGMDWVITWSNPDAGSTIVASVDPVTGANTSSVVSSTLTGIPGVVQSGMVTLLHARTDTSLRVAAADPVPNSPAAGSYGSMSSTSGALRFFVRSVDYTSSTGPDLFQTGYTSGGTLFLQPSQVQQAFDTEVRYLGPSFISVSSGGKAKNTGGLFLIRVTGRANVQGTTQSFVAQREALVDYNP